jgi:hypothetical protein
VSWAVHRKILAKNLAHTTCSNELRHFAREQSASSHVVGLAWGLALRDGPPGRRRRRRDAAALGGCVSGATAGPKELRRTGPPVVASDHAKRRESNRRDKIHEFSCAHLEGPRERPQLDEQTKFEIWDLAAGAFIAVSVMSSLSYLIVSAV